MGSAYYPSVATLMGADPLQGQWDVMQHGTPTSGRAWPSPWPPRAPPSPPADVRCALTDGATRSEHHGQRGCRLGRSLSRRGRRSALDIVDHLPDGPASSTTTRPWRPGQGMTMRPRAPRDERVVSQRDAGRARPSCSARSVPGRRQRSPRRSPRSRLGPIGARAAATAARAITAHRMAVTPSCLVTGRSSNAPSGQSAGRSAAGPRPTASRHSESLLRAASAGLRPLRVLIAENVPWCATRACVPSAEGGRRCPRQVRSLA